MNMLKRLFTMLFAVVLFCSLSITSFASTMNFKDLGLAPWAKSEIEYLSNLGIINGYSNTIFGPKDPLTRGQAVHILMKATHKDQKYEGKSIYFDVNQNKYYANSINLASKLGIINGYSDGSFQPDKKINRGETAALIDQVFPIKKGQRTVVFNDPLGWASPNILNLASNGIISGFSDGSFRPHQSISRAEFASFVARSMNKGFIPPVKPNINTDQIINAFEKEVFRLTNKERVKYGLSPLILNPELSKLARLKSKDMRDRKYFSHDSPFYGSPFDMMTQYNIHYLFAAENIAAGYASPASVVKGWMNSPGHRANILEPTLKEIGIGYVNGGSAGTYWTQMFITQ